MAGTNPKKGRTQIKDAKKGYDRSNGTPEVEVTDVETYVKRTAAMYPGYKPEDLILFFTAHPEKMKVSENNRLKFARALVERDAHKETHKVEYFIPLPHQEHFFDLVRAGKKTVLLVGANRIGKTVACAAAIGAFMLGCKEPWGEHREMFPSDRARRDQGKGVVGRILCKDWEKAAKDTIVPTLREWLPEGSYKTSKNNVGVESEWVFPETKSRLTICTYNEDTKSQEGWKGDFVLCDEPPPRDKYIANRRGLVDYNGILMMAMTAISEPWILDELVLKPDPSMGVIADVEIRANTFLSEEAIRIYERDLTEDEKVARIQGGWMQLTGRIWKLFSQRHVIEPFKIPPDWPVEAQIDFHLSTPHAISFCACDPLNRYFICDEVWENCSSEEIADHIGRKKTANTWRMKYAEVDALSKGDQAYVKNRFKTAEDSFTVIQRGLRKYGVALGVGSKDEKSYIKAVETRLRGVNGPEPTLYIFSTCTETIKQVSRWSYDDNHKPRDDGHFPECLGRFTQTGLHYTDPANWSRPLQYAPMGI